jgi:hypothetical protein
MYDCFHVSWIRAFLRLGETTSQSCEGCFQVVRRIYRNLTDGFDERGDPIKQPIDGKRHAIQFVIGTSDRQAYCCLTGTISCQSFFSSPQAPIDPPSNEACTGEAH